MWGRASADAIRARRDEQREQVVLRGLHLTHEGLKTNALRQETGKEGVQVTPAVSKRPSMHGTTSTQSTQAMPSQHGKQSTQSMPGMTGG